MKIINVIKAQNQLIKLKLIATKIKKNNNNCLKFNFENIICRLKKGLHIVYKYHIKNKKILFISNKNLNIIKTKIKKLLKLTKHVFINEYMWFNNKIFNTQHSISNFSQKILQNNILNFKTKNNLILMLNNQINKNIINENYKFKIPIVSLKNSLNIFNFKLSYKIPGNFFFENKKIKNNFFFILLKVILKKY